MTQLAVLLIFCVIAFFSIYDFKNQENYSRSFTIISYFIFLITIFRSSNELNDYDSYVNMFFHYDQPAVYEEVETSWVIIAAILNKLSLPPISIFIIYGGIALLFKIKAIKYSTPFIYCSLLLYISYEFINQELIAIRVGVSIAFILYSIKYIYDKNIYKYLLMMLLAIIFHRSAIICLPLYFISQIGTNTQRTIILVISFIFIFINFDFSSYLTFFSSDYKANVYLNSHNEKFNFLRITIIYRYLVYFYFLKYEGLIKPLNKYISIEINILLYGLVINNIFWFNEALSYRLSMLCFSVEYLLIPNLLYVYKKHLKAKLILIMLAVMNLSYLFLVTKIFH